MPFYKNSSPKQLSGSQLSNTEAIEELQRKVADLNRRCCCGEAFGITTLSPPVAEPGAGDPQVLFNAVTGILYYWEANHWEVFSSGEEPAVLPYYEAILEIEDVGGNLEVVKTILNTFPGATWETNSNVAVGAENGFEVHPVGTGIGYSGTLGFGVQSNIIYAADGSLVHLLLFGNGTDNIGVLPSLISTGAVPANTAFPSLTFPMHIRWYF